MFASESGQVALVRLLLARGADVNTLDKRGYTALNAATRKGLGEVAELLRAQGAR